MAAATWKELSDEAVQAAMGQLVAGVWVDLMSESQWVRAQVKHAGDGGGVFMLVSSGNKPHTMTRRICARLIKSGQLRPPGSPPVKG